MSNGDDRRVRVEGAADEHAPRRTPGALLLLLAGLIVGLAFGILLGPSGNSSDGVNELPTATTLVTPTTTPPTTTTVSAFRIERYQARIEVLESELADTQQQLSELGLQVDPGRFAVALDCDRSIGSQYPPGWQAESHFVGPIAFYRLTERLRAPGWDEVFAIVEPLDSATLVVPPSERGHYSLIWDPATWRDAAGYTVNDGGPAITLVGCVGEPTVFIGGFVADHGYCAPLDLYFGDSAEPERVILPFGNTDCPDGSVPLAKPEPGPIPDVTGLTLREARLGIRLVGLTPSVVSGGESLQPDSLVWAQEPNDGGTYFAGTIVGLRTCQSAAHVVATYQDRLDGSLPRTGITLSLGWMASSLSPGLESWYFVSALVSGGPTDGQIATWALPPWVAPADPANTPSLSFFVNDIAQGLGFGDSRFDPPDYGADNWTDLDGAIASQRCVDLSKGG